MAQNDSATSKKAPACVNVDTCHVLGLRPAVIRQQKITTHIYACITITRKWGMERERQGTVVRAGEGAGEGEPPPCLLTLHLTFMSPLYIFSGWWRGTSARWMRGMNPRRWLVMCTDTPNLCTPLTVPWQQMGWSTYTFTLVFTQHKCFLSNNCNDNTFFTIVIT